MENVLPAEPQPATDERRRKAADAAVTDEQGAAKRARVDEDVDEMLDETFPASDPPSYWAGC